MKHRIFSAGDCPTCRGFGAVVVLAERKTAELPFYCPACRTAWGSLACGRALDNVRLLPELAPAGVKLPTSNELQDLGEVFREVDYGDWEREFDELTLFETNR
jgi:hypothetical protein